MPVKQNKAPWTAVTLALLGKMSDAKLAKQVGCSHQAVSQRRRKRGIKPHSPYQKSTPKIVTPKPIREMSAAEFKKISTRAVAAMSR